MSTQRTIRRAFTTAEANLLLDVIDDKLAILACQIGDGVDGKTSDGRPVATAEAEVEQLKAIASHLSPR